MGRCWKWCHDTSVGLLLLRVVLGAYFIGHGIAKLQYMDSTISAFNQWGFPAALTGVFSYVVAVSELLAGSAIVLGAFLWPAAALIIIIMTVAISVVVGPNPDNDPALIHFVFGWGMNLIYAAAALALAFTGAGKWSLAGWWMRRHGANCMQCKADHGLQYECKKDDMGNHHPDCSCAMCGCGKK